MSRAAAIADGSTPGTPIGYWFAALVLTGNASGGTLSIDLLFQSALTGFLNSQMYSVERLAVRTNDAADRIVSIQAPNMGGPQNLGFSHEYAVLVSQLTNVASSAIRSESLTFLPWFLGSQRLPAISASVSIVTENTNGTEFKLEAEGYRWSPRSVLIDGGPQRPPTGLYRA